MSLNKITKEMLIFLLGCSGMAAAEDNYGQKKIETEVHVYRDLVAEKGPYRLYIRTGIWQPGGELYNSENPDVITIEGYQKGNNIKLSSYDAEKGLSEPLNIL